MAKISAHGCRKVSQANKQWRDDEGWDHKVILALRSDGKVLRKHSLRSPSSRDAYGSRGWNEGTYSIVGSLTENESGTALDRFTRYAEQRGFDITI
jgi:hypothetical protein